MNKDVFVIRRKKKPLVVSAVCLLVRELLRNGKVESFGSRVLVTISKADYEFRLGSILQQIYQIIDDNFPERRHDIAIVIRDPESGNEHVFKIWPSAQFIT